MTVLLDRPIDHFYAIRSVSTDLMRAHISTIRGFHWYLHNRVPYYHENGVDDRNIKALCIINAVIVRTIGCLLTPEVHI